MSADLKHLNDRHLPMQAATSYAARVNKTIIRLYAFTMISVLIGSGIALYGNWELRIQDAQTHLQPAANMGNYLIETALTDAEKSLSVAQTEFTQALEAGPLDHAVAYRLLQKNYEKFKKYNKADVFGLIFFVNRDGQLLARSGSPTITPIDFTDRYYYYHLRENPDAHHAIGPLIYARTTQLWVFHMSVPVHDKDGQFAGVLVQQISVDDITRILRLASHTDDFFQMVGRVRGQEALFVFPPPGEADTPSKELQQALFAMRGGPKAKAGSLNVNGHLQALTKPLLVQTANSSRYDLETHVTLPVAAVMRGFLQANMVFVVYLSLGLGLSSAIFYYLLGLSQKLANAQEASLYDPLTKIHNRRALDDTLPVLLSESMRSREPISVLFIDIDHFRYFNETYGHESGDTALKAVAHTLADCARRPLDFVCRWGGEEFVIVLPKTNRHAAMQIAQEILTAVRAIHLQTDKGQKQSVTVSIGFVTDVVTTATKQDDLVDEADKAMLQAKNQGRDQCVEYLLAA